METARATKEEFYIVLVTCTEKEAAGLAQTLVQEGLVACVNIVPSVTSVYKWKGEVVKDQENLLVMKTLDSFYDRLEARIKELHSYEVPEVLAISVKDGSSAYLDWLSGSLLKQS